MNSNPTQFGKYLLSHWSNGEIVPVSRSADEIIFLAFDCEMKRMVEIHVLKSVESTEDSFFGTTLDRVQAASKIEGKSLMQVLDAGMEDGMVYYATSINDGEPVAEYVKRCGRLAPSVAVSLMTQLVDDLASATGVFGNPLSGLSLEHAYMSLEEEIFLSLRVVDYGFSKNESTDITEQGRRVVQECSKLLFLLLTGEHYQNQELERSMVIAALPNSLRALMREALLSPQYSCASLEKMREDLREAYQSLVNNYLSRNLRKHLLVTEQNQPQSQLQKLLLAGMDFTGFFQGRYSFPPSSADLQHCPFSIEAVHVEKKLPVTLHLLPPSSIVDRAAYNAVPLEIWKFNPNKHHHLLRSLSVWETPSWTLITEERDAGFSLARLLAQRHALNPDEALIILKEVHAGLMEAAECGVSRVNLHPAHIQINTPAVTDSVVNYIEKPLDTWPSLSIKLRTHTTMRSLYDAPVVSQRVKENGEELTEVEFALRSLVALSLRLLGAQKHGPDWYFENSVSSPLANYLRECSRGVTQNFSSMSLKDFLSRFENLLYGPESDTPGMAAIKAAAALRQEELKKSQSVTSFLNPNTWTAALRRNMPTYSRHGKKTPVTGPILRPSKPARTALLALGSLALASGGFFLIAGKPINLGNDHNSPPEVHSAPLEPKASPEIQPSTPMRQKQIRQPRPSLMPSPIQPTVEDQKLQHTLKIVN